MAIRKGGSPTGFVNLERYLQGNQGAGSQMVGAITQGLGQQEQAEAQKQATQASQIVESQVGAGQKKAEELAGKIKQAPGQVVGQAKEFIGQQYTPQDLGTQQAAIKAQQKAAEEKIGLLGTQEGQQAALQQQFGKQTPYSSGFSALDQFLIGADPMARQALESKTQSVKSQVGETTSKALADINKAQQTAAQKAQEQKALVNMAAKDRYSRMEEKASRLANEKTRSQDAERWRYEKGTEKAASYADVLSDKELADIKALAQISGRAWNPEQEQKRYTLGTERIRPVKTAGAGKFRG